jgi:chorismate synthase
MGSRIPSAEASHREAPIAVIDGVPAGLVFAEDDLEGR